MGSREKRLRRFPLPNANISHFCHADSTSTEGHEAGEQEESQSDFHNSGFDPLRGQELGPIELYFLGGLDERPIQII